MVEGPDEVSDGCDGFDAGVATLSCVSEAAERAGTSQDALMSPWAVKTIVWGLWGLMHEGCISAFVVDNDKE